MDTSKLSLAMYFELFVPIPPTVYRWAPDMLFICDLSEPAPALPPRGNRPPTQLEQLADQEAGDDRTLVVRKVGHCTTHTGLLLLVSLSFTVYYYSHSV